MIRLVSASGAKRIASDCTSARINKGLRRREAKSLLGRMVDKNIGSWSLLSTEGIKST